MKRPYRIAAFAVLIALLVLARAVAPTVLERQINSKLASLDRYTGSVGGVDLHLWRAAYSIQDVRIIKRHEAPDRPLFAADRLHFSFGRASSGDNEWVTAVNVVGSRVNFIDGVGDRDQAGAGTNWLRLFDALSPFPIDQLSVREGAVHFYNFAGAHVFLAEVNGAMTDLSRSINESQPLPARLEVEAKAMDRAPAKLQVDLAPRVQPPAFDLRFRMEQLDLADFRLLAKSYAPFDINAGRMDLVMELRAKDGRVDGYAKPLLEDVEILSIDVDVQQDGDNPVRLLLEAGAALIAELLENRSSDRIATRIPISGNLDAMQRDWIAAIGGVLANAFIEGMQSDFESESPPRTQGRPDGLTPSDLHSLP